MIDSHCHLDDPRFDADRAAVLARARDAGVEAVLVPGIGPERWDVLSCLPASEPPTRFALGLHPCALEALPEAEDATLLLRLEARLAARGPAAVGECGLDGRLEPRVPWARQEATLRAQLALARRFDLPLIVHCVRAHPRLQALLREEPLPSRGLVIHGFSGSAELARWYVRRGVDLSFSGAVCAPAARRALEALREVPAERLLVETDAPDQAPHPAQGRNEPALLPRVVEAVARARGADIATVATVTADNARRLFGPWPSPPPPRGARGAAPG